MRSWGGGIVIYRSYALYEEEKTYNVLKGTIPDFDYDVKLAVTIDGNDSKAIPETPYKSEDQYYEAQVDCDNGAQGEWDYNSWNLKVDYLTNTNTKCKVSFTSTINKETYEKYIKTGVATRRNTYRGKDITGYLEDGSLFEMIKDGTFKDIYVGDYIISPTHNNIIWLVADIDNYLYTGDTDHKLTRHHLTIIPAGTLTGAPMNDSNTTAGGYANSQMVKSTLTQVYDQYIAPDFTINGENHVIPYRNLLSSEIDPEANNKSGNSQVKGASSNWTWCDRNLDLMSEVNVFGTTITSSSFFDTGIDNRQYAIFQLKPEFINSYGTNYFYYWLKDITDTTHFAVVFGHGESDRGEANSWGSTGVRPRFLIG